MKVAERKLPSEARSADEVMEDYRQYRSRLNPVLAPLLVPDPENIYRWRVQYDCGCIEEQLATNDNVEWLLAHSHTDPISRQRLPAGQFLCEKSARKHKRSPEPEQLIVGWIDREVKDFPPDPVEPPELWADDPEIWALVRQTTAHSSAFRTVILACGHAETMVTDVDWVFGQPPHFVSEERAGEMAAELETMPDDDHKRKQMRLVKARYPRPAPWLPCTMCTWVKSLVAYERIGWLVPPPKPPRKPRRQRSREEILHEQVKRTERELARLRRELKEVTSAPAQSSTDNASPSARRGKPGR
jgi:hypothetical protein